MLNKAMLQGRLTADPELRSTPSGVSVTNFTLAVTRSYKKDGEQETDFIPCVAWRSTAEFVHKHFQKGQQAVVDGSIQTRSYTDKDGNKRTAFEVVIDNIHFADSKKDAEQTAPPPAAQTAPQSSANSYTFPQDFDPQQQGFSQSQYKPPWEVDADMDDLPF